MESDSPRIVRFQDDFSEQWDNFISQNSYNGTFVNKRKFLNYHHKERFKEHSLVFLKNHSIVAILPACEVELDGEKIFFSHRGSTFGGLIFSKRYFKIAMINNVIALFNEYIEKSEFKKIILKQVPSIFSEDSVDNLEYLLGSNGYNKYEELSFVIDLHKIKEGQLIENFRPNTRSKVRQGIKQGLTCKYVDSEDDIAKFHDILTSNLKKHDAKPIHTKSELTDLKSRFPESIQFVHCCKDDVTVAASMIWNFDNKVLHTQNLSTNYQYKELRPVNYMIYYLIKEAIANNFHYFSFGISTEDQGKYLNFGLAEFKEGFGAKGYLNKIFFKNL